MKMKAANHLLPFLFPQSDREGGVGVLDAKLFNLNIKKDEEENALLYTDIFFLLG